ncbi:hypothetical protein H5410_002847 [Solanum commersonii]|uniref:Uncharacterized protein n=1 Tax=Solanum commersonii TaxID=4109 RepID=A0A9J6B3H2_SOLCO|nr:hypothetical protein H5410_002847 [Solanum commersonii]
MPFLITLGLVETLFDPIVDRVKRELAGTTTIKRERVDSDLVFFNKDMVDAAIKAGVNIGGGGGICADAEVVGQSVGATSCSRCSGFLCEKCKKHDEDSIMAMTSMDIWWEDWYIDDILSLMRERHLRFSEYYDFTDRIMDLNFYTNFKQRYDSITEEATRVGGKNFNQLLNAFVWNDDMIDYVRGILKISSAFLEKVFCASYYIRNVMYVKSCNF